MSWPAAEYATLGPYTDRCPRTAKQSTGIPGSQVRFHACTHTKQNGQVLEPVNVGWSDLFLSISANGPRIGQVYKKPMWDSPLVSVASYSYMAFSPNTFSPSEVSSDLMSC